MSVPRVLLGLLEKEPLYGYTLKQRYDDLFAASRPLAYGQVYSTLSRLERDGLATPGADTILQQIQPTWVIFADPGPDVLERLRTDVSLLDPGGELSMTMPDYSALLQANGYRTVLWTLTGIAILVGLTALAVAAIDNAIERRRQTVALRMLGAPAWLPRRSQLLQVLIPLGLGIPFAGALGLLAGTSYLAFVREQAHAPWQSTLTMTAVAAAAAVALAVLTIPASVPPLTPDLLRRD